MVRLGVPQGSVLEPYILYMADIPLLFVKHAATGHLNADGIQVFVHGSPDNQLTLVSSAEKLVHHLHFSMSSNRLSLNSSTSACPCTLLIS